MWKNHVKSSFSTCILSVIWWNFIRKYERQKYCLSTFKNEKIICSQSVSFEVGRTSFGSQRIQVGSYSVKSGPHEAPSWQSHTQHVLGSVGQVCIYWSAIVVHSLLYQCCIYTLPWNFYRNKQTVLSIQSKSNNGLTLYQEVILLSQILITTDNDDFLLKLFQVHGKREASFAILIGDCGCILLTVNIYWG